MPAKWFACPDYGTIEIERCLKTGGCRMEERCATLPYLRAIAFDRKWKGVSPSSAGNGPRLLYLKAVMNYTINPQDRVWALLGTGTHDKLALEKYTGNVLAEEKLSDEQMGGIADALEEDENAPGCYILSDYKTWGSYKVATAIGKYQEEVNEEDEDGNPILLKSGKNKGKPKTKKVTMIDPKKADLGNEELQLNRYRIFYEQAGFPISRMQIQAIPRDGNTFIAKSRGIDKNIYIIPIERLPDQEVLYFYENLQAEVDDAFRTDWTRICSDHESWEKRRCENYCEVAEFCAEMENRKT